MSATPAIPTTSQLVLDVLNAAATVRASYLLEEMVDLPDRIEAMIHTLDDLDARIDGLPRRGDAGGVCKDYLEGLKRCHCTNCGNEFPIPPGFDLSNSICCGCGNQLKEGPAPTESTDKGGESDGPISPDCQP